MVFFPRVRRMPARAALERFNPFRAPSPTRSSPSTSDSGRPLTRGLFSRFTCGSGLSPLKLYPTCPHSRTFGGLYPSSLRSFHSSRQVCSDESKPEPRLPPMTDIPPERIRNFCIISHIDHGKTTLSARLLKDTGTIRDSANTDMYTDKLQVEKERGITVKAQTASMLYDHITVDENGEKKKEQYLLNLIDTPGHVDFSYEVSRSLSACEGAVLIVDATQGIQAQTVANFYLAFEEGLTIIPVLNKIDLPTAQVEACLKEMKTTLDMDPSSVLMISAKTGVGVDTVLPAVIKHIPAPSPDASVADLRPVSAASTSGAPPSAKFRRATEDPNRASFRSLLFDNWYNQYRGVVCLVRVLEGSVRVGDSIVAGHSDKVYEVDDVGILFPEETFTGEIQAGQVGYLTCGMRSTSEAMVGDTIYRQNRVVPLLSGFKKSKPMVFAGLFPTNNDQFDEMEAAVAKLILNDASVVATKETSDALGVGFRCGFLGLLHMDVFLQRLEQEYNVPVIATSPTVPYKMRLTRNRHIQIKSPADFPADPTEIVSSEEPIAASTIIVPSEFIGPVMRLLQERRGEQQEFSYVDEKRVLLRYRLPLAEIISDFFDRLKEISSGYASFDYEDAGYQKSDLVKVSMLLNGELADPLSLIVHRDKADSYGRDVALKLKSVISRQMFAVAIQASVGNKVIARETVQAFRKNVTAKCYGGDVSRKRKLLDKQKEGKKRMKMIGNVELDQKAFFAVLKQG
eukprot:TRINITY_DN4264_c0_g1_i1.p1 TRINITY_DN4264_c0_g1~~TRINITY_DN4264_c0_g1_i1.p1  ORF type:complete len:740 (+),score=136.44 TRINITY_DN4264_c0_g1_i1:152-2371(+)